MIAMSDDSTALAIQTIEGQFCYDINEFQKLLPDRFFTRGCDFWVESFFYVISIQLWSNNEFTQMRALAKLSDIILPKILMQQSGPSPALWHPTIKGKLCCDINKLQNYFQIVSSLDLWSNPVLKFALCDLNPTLMQRTNSHRTLANVRDITLNKLWSSSKPYKETFAVT